MPTEVDRLREQCGLYDRYISMLYSHINGLVSYIESQVRDVVSVTHVSG